MLVMEFKILLRELDRRYANTVAVTMKGQSQFHTDRKGHRTKDENYSYYVKRQALKTDPT